MKESLSDRKVLTIAIVTVVVISFISFCVLYWIFNKSLKVSLIITFIAAIGVMAEYIYFRKRKKSNQPNTR